MHYIIISKNRQDLMPFPFMIACRLP